MRIFVMNRSLRKIFIGATVVLIYLVVVMYVFQHHIKSSKRAKYMPPPPKLLVLVSQPRSGSSYLSNVISKSVQSIFFYEPLYRLDQLLNMDCNFPTTEAKQRKYNDYASHYLKNVFKCTFKERNEWAHIFRSRFKEQSTLQGNQCLPGDTQKKIAKEKRKKNVGYIIDRCMPYFDRNQLEHDCRRYNLMVKLLEMRLPLKSLVQLETFVSDQTSYKIIYLTRDPRASFWSMLRLGWVSQVMDDTYKTYIELRCDEMYQSVTTTRNKNNIVIIRYEDLMTKPKTALADILEFIDRDSAEKILAQLETHDCYVPVFNEWFNKTITNPEERHLKRLLLSQDTDAKMADHEGEEEIDFKKIEEKQRRNYECFTINKWRYAVNAKFVKIVEERCKKFMNVMGYKLVDNDAHVIKNTKQSLVQDFLVNTEDRILQTDNL